jgi:hypothetical protein
MTMITKRRAAVSAGAVPSMGVFGPKRAGDRLAGSIRTWLEQSGLSFSDPTRNVDSLTMLWIWRFILASVGFVKLAVLLFWAMGGFGELGLSANGLVALTLGFLFTMGLATGLVRSSSSATAAVATTRPIGRASAKRERPFP